MNGRRAKILRRQARATVPSKHMHFDPRVIQTRYRALKKAWKKQQRHPNP